MALVGIHTTDDGLGASYASLIALYVTVPDAQFVPVGGGMCGTTNGNGRDKVMVYFVRAYGIATAQTVLRGAKLAARPTGPRGALTNIGTQGGAANTMARLPYVPVTFSPGASTHVADPSSTLLVVHGSTGQPIARMWPGTAASMWFNTTSACATVPGMLPTTTDLGSGRYVFAAGQVTQFSAPDVGTSTPVLYQYVSAQAVSLAFDDATNAYQDATAADAALFSGACPTMYDGANLVEHGFSYSPYRLTAAVRTPARNESPGALSAGTYSYTAIYEWTDANGIVHWSGAAPAVSVTATALQKVDLVVHTLRATAKSGVRVVIFRTIAGGTVYYRLTNTGASASSDVLLNSTSADYVSFTDASVSDAVLAQRASLYTTGGTLENEGPPPLICPVVHRRRVIGIDASNRLSLPYSKQVAVGSPVEFALEFTLEISAAGGDCTALASLDDKLIVFKADRIFMITGQGPDPTGGQLDWSDSILVSSDVGCTAPKSIVVMPAGLMFQSQKGIYLLGRNLAVSYIGAPMEEYNADAVLSGALMPDVQQVRMQQAARTLVYDYAAGQWSVFLPAGTAVDSLVWNGGHAYVTSTGIVGTETPGEYSDVDGYGVPVSFLMSWISMAALQGFGRVRRVLFEGAADADATINVALGTNYDEQAQYIPGAGTVFMASSAQAASFTTTRTSTGNWQETIHLRQQKCEAVQIGFYESGDADAYLELSAITLEVGVKRGTYKQAAAQATG